MQCSLTILLCPRSDTCHYGHINRSYLLNLGKLVPESRTTLGFNETNKKHLKNVGPIRYCEPPLHCQSPGVASRMPAIAIAQAACDAHDDNNNDNA